MFADHLLAQILVTTIVVFFFVGSLLGLLLGLGLTLRSATMLSFIELMNQWVSMRQALKPLELPLQLAPAATGARWFGAVLIAVGTYAALILILNMEVNQVAALFKVDPRSSLAMIALDAAKWFLVVGSLGAMATGIMLFFFPRAWRSVEARANRWYSTRNLEIAGDTLYMSLDRIVAVYPRASGLVILGLSLVAAIASGMLLFGRR